jgi:hypothetical protein
MLLRPVCLALAFAPFACASRSNDTPAPTPATGQSESLDDEYEDDEEEEEEESLVPEGFSVTSAEAARTAAENAVAERLDRKLTWKSSPVVPAQWPSKDARVAVYLYPMAANPNNTSYYQLFTPAFRVEVALTDGATEVEPVGKRREIGSMEDRRPTSLERRELDIAEEALLLSLMGVEKEGDEPYWGYLKFVVEHPEIGRDLEKRNPGFFGWIHERYGK